MAKQRSSNSNFKKGSGVFTCCICGRKTRATGRGDNEQCGMCPSCYDDNEEANGIADNRDNKEETEIKESRIGMTYDEYQKLISNNPPEESEDVTDTLGLEHIQEEYKDEIIPGICPWCNKSVIPLFTGEHLNEAIFQHGSADNPIDVIRNPLMCPKCYGVGDYDDFAIGDQLIEEDDESLSRWNRLPTIESDEQESCDNPECRCYTNHKMTCEICGADICPHCKHDHMEEHENLQESKKMNKQDKLNFLIEQELKTVQGVLEEHIIPEYENMYSQMVEYVLKFGIHDLLEDLKTKLGQVEQEGVDGPNTGHTGVNKDKADYISGAYWWLDDVLKRK